MIGRGAVGNPWIFHQLKSGSEILSNEIKREIILEHFDSMIYFYGERGVVLFRKHLHTYSKGIEGASEFRNIVNSIEDVSKARELLENYF
jgi:tRNA-dihydrouridine synthase B